jgi:ribosomal protein S18 acetylase RimI-like enzyme
MMDTIAQPNGLMLEPPDKAMIRALLMQDPIANAYALADLQPHYAPQCRWTVRYRGNDAGSEAAVVLLYMGLEPPIVLASGAVDLVEEALQEVDLPASIYMSVAHPVYALLQKAYDFGEDVRPMWRMALHRLPEMAEIQAVAKPLRVVRLQPDDALRIQTLIAHGGDFTPDAFEPSQLADGTFFGVENAAGDLLAVGGTHVVAPDSSLAAIGNMYTHPQWRQKGLGRAVLQAIVTGLYAQKLDTIVLNVDQRNGAARRLYEQFGFVVHCEYLEGIGILRT